MGGGGGGGTLWLCLLHFGCFQADLTHKCSFKCEFRLNWVHLSLTVGKQMHMKKPVPTHLWLSHQLDKPCVILISNTSREAGALFYYCNLPLEGQEKKLSVRRPSLSEVTHATVSVTHTTFKMKTSYEEPLAHTCPHTRSSSHLPLTHSPVAQSPHSGKSNQGIREYRQTEREKAGGDRRRTEGRKTRTGAKE